MIHAVEHTDGPTTYVISSHGTWRPGAYDSREAARVAQRLTDGQLERVRQHALAEGRGVITLAMLRARYGGDA